MKAFSLLPSSIALTALIVALPITAETRQNGAASLDQDASNEKASDGLLLPDWPTDSFDWNIGPIIGGRARKTEYGGVKYDTISSEIGIGTRVHGIPIVPGNPGATLEPYASFTWGNRTIKAKNASIDETESTGYQRQWYGVLGRVYYQAFRYSLDIGLGKIEHDDRLFTDLSARRYQNDFGVLIVPFFSAHYTLTRFLVNEEGDSKPTIDELDHWIHARLAFSLFKSSLDFGPGQTQTKYAGRATPSSPVERIATVDTTYLKALASMNIFWKLGLSGSAKYILSAEEVNGLNDAIDQLPNENLAQNKSLANLPEGSLEASLFFGLRQLFAGFGVGWQTYYLELNNDKSAKQIKRDQGLVVTYEGGF